MLWMNRRQRSGVLGIEVRDAGIAFALRTASESKPSLHGYLATAAQTDIPAAIEDALSGTNLKNVACNVSLAPEDSFLVQVTTPPVADDELLEALRWSVKDMVDYNIDEAVIDAFPVPEDALRGRDPMMNVVGARKPRLRGLVDLCKSLGVEIHAIDVAELSLRNLVRDYGSEERAIALLLLEHDSGTVLIFRNDTLYFSRQISCSESIFQGAPDEATNEARDQVCLELQRSLDYFESQLGQAAPRQVLIAAGPGTVDLQLAIVNNLAIEPIVLELGDTDEDLEHQPSLCRAIGSSMRLDTLP